VACGWWKRAIRGRSMLQTKEEKKKKKKKKLTKKGETEQRETEMEGNSQGSRKERHPSLIG